ncbi:unnamed protein product [Oppiella nova]|uniref:Uncharacterized protein n=1 Tax=Oppiella nova TaxID=334625 RepID=A0A7R9LJ76_9ACAR|nr:unnamed protein product [Oppiella nova]CAG2164176.1 unnamed protein product [Oppiella nova]
MHKQSHPVPKTQNGGNTRSADNHWLIGFNGFDGDIDRHHWEVITGLAANRWQLTATGLTVRTPFQPVSGHTVVVVMLTMRACGGVIVCTSVEADRIQRSLIGHTFD